MARYLDEEGGVSEDRCMWCDLPATRLCDAALALVSAGIHKPAKGAAYEITSMDAMLSGSYTCDAPLCDKHRKVAGFVCGKVGDTIDYCPHHAALGDSGRPLPLLALDDIAKLRADLHALIRRGKFRLIQADPPIHPPSSHSKI